MWFAFGVPLHHVDFNLTLPKWPMWSSSILEWFQNYVQIQEKTDYKKNYFRFNIRIKVSTIAFSQPSISFWLIFRVSSFLIPPPSLLSSLIYLFFLRIRIFRWHCQSLPIHSFAHFFAVWTFYTVMRDEYSLEKSSPQLFKISSACTNC